jgi:predicted peptidase
LEVPVHIPRRSLVLPFLLAVVAATVAVNPARAKKVETGFLDRTLSLAGTEYKYQVFVPQDWSPKKKWPMILFLHGAGERGDDGQLQSEVGIGRAIRLDRSRFPAVVVIPQCRKNAWWSESPMDDLAMAALQDATKEFHGDRERTYLTGLSMGGYGTWHLAGKYPGRFAAIVPICGGILRPDISRKQSRDDTKPYADAAKKIGSSTPTWIFHGGADDTVPVAESQRMAAAMKALGGEVHYTEYPGVSHNSWDNAYAEPELITWMLSKTSSGATSK